MFRIYFLYNRSLLPKLSHCGWETITEVFQTTLGRDDVIPGLVMDIQTYLPGGRQVAGGVTGIHICIVSVLTDVLMQRVIFIPCLVSLVRPLRRSLQVKCWLCLSKRS